MTEEQLYDILKKSNSWGEEIPYEDIISSMKEAVEKGSIGFAKWFNKNYQEFMVSGLYFKQFKPEHLSALGKWPDLEELKRFTIEEIYSEYIKSLEK